MLVLTALVAIPLALYVNHDRRPSARTVAILRTLGAHVIYDYQLNGETRYSKFAKWFGEDYFGSVVSVRMDGGSLSQEQLEMLVELPRLEKLLLSHVDCDVSSWKPLEQSHEVESLDLWSCPIADSDIDVLRKLPKLRYLNLSQSMITDAGLVKLADFRQLRSLSLFQTMISPEGLAGIRAALPKCHIQDIGGPVILAAILKMPDGRRTNQHGGKFTVKLSSNGRSMQTSSSGLHPGHLWFTSLLDNDGFVTLTVTLGDRYSGSVTIRIANGIAEPRFVEVPMRDLQTQGP